MKKFIIGRTDERCPVCGNQLTIIYYGEPGKQLKDIAPNPSFIFCWGCNDRAEELVKKIRGILLLGDKQT